ALGWVAEDYAGVSTLSSPTALACPRWAGFCRPLRAWGVGGRVSQPLRAGLRSCGLRPCDTAARSAGAMLAPCAEPDVGGREAGGLGPPKKTRRGAPEHPPPATKPALCRRSAPWIGWLTTTPGSRPGLTL